MIVEDINRSPEILAQTYQVLEDETIVFYIEHSDPDGDVVHLSNISNSANGSIIGAFPDFLYTPVSNFYGVDSFDLTLEDDFGNQVNSTIYIEVVPVNDKPVVSGDIVLRVDQNSTVSLQI